MPLIYVDANVYLDSYRRVSSAYRDLLTSLVSLAPNVFVPRQVAFEVERNRVNAYLDANKIDIKTPGLGDLRIAPHYADDTTAVDEINKKVKQLGKHITAEVRKIANGMEKIHQQNLHAIIAGVDDVTMLLDKMFRVSEVETAAQLSRARLRKERGQPPGKKNDPLGDQISWEQILDRAVDADSIWIVSRDGDYTVTDGNKVFLRPTLHRELGSARGVKAIHCHAYLATFFDEFSRAGLVRRANLPPKASIKIAKEELPEDIIFEPSTWGLDAELFGHKNWVLPLSVRKEHLMAYLKCPADEEGIHDFSVPALAGPVGGIRRPITSCKKCGLKFAFTTKRPTPPLAAVQR